MKLLILWSVLLCYGGFSVKAQNPEVLNKYRAVFVPPLFYEKNKSDIYGIRQTVIEKLTACGVPLFLDEHSIPRNSMTNPCSMLQCLVNNTSSPREKSASIVSVLFFNCSNDTVLSYFSRSDLHLTFSETRNSFLQATQKALEIFDNYHYQFTDSAASIVQPVSTANDSIQWNPERKLTWDDFKGTANDVDPADALTYTVNQTFFESFSAGSRFEVESHITCFFIKSKSWVKSDKKSDYLLNHEQRHFDLAEIGARDFRKRLKKIRLTKENFHDEIQHITAEVNGKCHRLQQQYDDETDHSRLEEKQQEWNRKIDTMLKDSENYK